LLEIGSVEMGKSFVWIKQPVVFEQRQRRQRLYDFRVVANNVWSSMKMVGTLASDDSSAGVNG
jgi:hypothetical protein